MINKKLLELISKHDKIIVDGTDAAGKSALVAEINKQFGHKMLRETKDTPNNLDWYKKQYDTPKFVSDRSFLSELVYSSIFKRECKLNEDEADELLTKLVTDDILVIIATNSPEAATKIIIERGETQDHSYIEALNNWAGIKAYLFMAQATVFEYIMEEHNEKEN